MFHLRRARCVLLLSFAGFICLSLPCTSAQAQSLLTSVSGTVYDPSGARIPHASVSLQDDRHTFDASTDGQGRFSLSVPKGNYRLSIAAPGFTTYTGPVSLVSTAAAVHLELPLTIAVNPEKVVVPIDDATDTSASNNVSALVFQGADLAAFSNDDATFQQELLALAGGIDLKSVSIFVDGFSGGRFPPKSSILSVHINRNPYSAAYDSLGNRRVEISTKPGKDKLHGQFNINATDSSLNSLNPYIVGTAPPYYVLNLDGNLTGPIDKKTSFFLSGVYNDQQNNAVLNAVTAVNGQPTAYAQTVRDPQLLSTNSVRMDRQFTPDNIFTSRYEFNQVNLTNGGLTAPLTIATQAFNSGITTQTLQFSDTQVFGPHLVSESHFQYIRSRQQQNAVSDAPTLLVEGAFSGGGNPAQALRDNRDRFEFQQQLSVERGSHYLRFGVRYRLLRDANLATANYNGQYTFPSIAAYMANTPSLYSGTVGQSSFSLLTGDLSAYVEDEWKVASNLTLDFGLRLESQSAIPDHLDIAPRIGAAWALRRRDKKVDFVTLRAGGGIFYNRFDAANILTTIRQNGVSQQTHQVADPCYNPTGAPLTTAGCPAVAASPPTPYRLNPNFRAEYGWIGGLSAEKAFGRTGTVSLSYLAIRGVHQSDSLNINAPLPGTYNPAMPSSGVRPFGGSQNIYQFNSNGISKAQIAALNSRLNIGKFGNVFVSYNYTHQDQNITGAATFASNSYNLSQDYGRSPQPSQQLFIGGTGHLPLGVDVSIFTSTQGGVPFNITTGTDLNGDTIYNDRPAFATSPTTSSVIYNTRYGLLDANPQPGEKLIPINYGNSPNFLYLDLSASRSFRFGPRPSSVTAAPGAKPVARLDPPFAVTFTVDSPNVTNHRNPGQPVGVLSSPYFGQSTILNEPFSSNTAANRIVYLQAQFSF